MELTQNLWERYGFTGNPYDTKALSLSRAAPLSVQAAYIARAESTFTADLITNFFRNPGGGRIIVEGDQGVGKTTFVNYHRQRWATLLLSPALELEMQASWLERDLLINLLACLSSRVRLEMTEKEYKRSTLLCEITALVGVHFENAGGFNATLSVLGTGGGLGRSKATSITVGEVTNDILRQYFSRILALIKKQGYSGVIIHLDNFDKLGVSNADTLKQFFESARDVLQEPDVYYVFVGSTGLFQKVIVPLPRVRSIFFDTPIHLEPLSIDEVKNAMAKRYRLLAAPDREWIDPVSDEVVENLYAVFNGRIRYIMNSITSLITHLPDSYAQSLDLSQALSMLQGIVTSEINRVLKGAEMEVFLEATRMNRFTNSELGSRVKKSKQMIQKYLRNWLSQNLVYRTEKIGRNQYYMVEPRYILLKGPARPEAGNPPEHGQ